jgi:TPR repeat protein
MARFEVHDADLAAIGQQNMSGDVFFHLGITYSVGRGVTPDMIAAHKWFNLAAARGNREAARHRQEIAGEMSSAQIAEAQRQAREWLSTH